MHTMTPRQREIATKAHNMIYSYLRLRKLPIDDYYDVVVFGFMEAVQQYDENEELAKKYSLTTIAYRKMDDRLAAFRIYEKRQKRTADVRSLEAPLAYAENMCIADTVPSTAEGPAQEAETNRSRNAPRRHRETQRGPEPQDIPPRKQRNASARHPAPSTAGFTGSKHTQRPSWPYRPGGTKCHITTHARIADPA